MENRNTKVNGIPESFKRALKEILIKYDSPELREALEAFERRQKEKIGVNLDRASGTLP